MSEPKETITPFALENARQLISKWNDASRAALEHSTPTNKAKVAQLDMTLAGYVAVLVNTIDVMREYISLPIKSYPFTERPKRPESGIYDDPGRFDAFMTELGAYHDAMQARKFLEEIDAGYYPPLPEESAPVSPDEIPF